MPTLQQASSDWAYWYCFDVVLRKLKARNSSITLSLNPWNKSTLQSTKSFTLSLNLSLGFQTNNNTRLDSKSCMFPVEGVWIDDLSSSVVILGCSCVIEPISMRIVFTERKHWTSKRYTLPKKYSVCFPFAIFGLGLSFFSCQNLFKPEEDWLSRAWNGRVPIFHSKFVSQDTYIERLLGELKCPCLFFYSIQFWLWLIYPD